MINMALRTGWSVLFIQRYFQRHDVQVETTKMRPRSTTIASCVGTAAILRAYTPEKGFMIQNGLASLLLPLVVICGGGVLSM
jgi:hypothetical protein